MNGQKDGWDKVQAVASMLGSIAIPIVLLFLGQLFTEAASEREAKARSVELAIEILRDPPQGEEIPGLREWAKQTVDKNLDIRLSNVLLKRPLPGSGSGEKMICGAEVRSPCGSCKAPSGEVCCIRCGSAQSQ